jgi:predicted nucleic acid-binding protein
MAWVFDASITMAWCFDDEKTPDTEALLDRLLLNDPAVVPQLWPLEVGNVLTLAYRKNRISSAERAEFLELLRTASIAIDPHTAGRALTTILPLAETHRLTTYDATYLELAMRLGVPLATLDKNLRHAAGEAGVSLL